MQTSFWSPFLADLRALSDFGDGLLVLVCYQVSTLDFYESIKSFKSLNGTNHCVEFFSFSRRL